MATSHPYKKLPGNGSQVLIPAPWVYLIALVFPIVLLLRNRVRLFQGADHILSVTSTGYTETYKRFYYREIQAITLRRTSDALAWNAVWVTLLVIFLSIALSVNAEARIAFGIVTAVFGLSLLTNILLGPTCACHIKSAVQMEPLLALNRVRSARKTIRRIQELVAVHQKADRPATEPASVSPIATA